MLIGKKIVAVDFITVLLNSSAKTFWHDFCGDKNRANPTGQARVHHRNSQSYRFQQIFIKAK